MLQFKLLYIRLYYSNTLYPRNSYNTQLIRPLRVIYREPPKPRCYVHALHLTLPYKSSANTSLSLSLFLLQLLPPACAYSSSPVYTPIPIENTEGARSRDSREAFEARLAPAAPIYIYLRALSAAEAWERPRERARCTLLSLPPRERRGIRRVCGESDEEEEAQTPRDTRHSSRSRIYIVIRVCVWVGFLLG